MTRPLLLVITSSFANMRRRSNATFLMTSVVLFWDRTQGVTSDIDAITKPLHEKIEIWTKRETLEAATEQFRVRANFFNESLGEKQSRCGRLERTIVEDLHRNRDEISLWRTRLEAQESKFSAMESEYQNLLWGEKAKVSYQERELLSKDIEILHLQEQLVAFQASASKKSNVADAIDEIVLTRSKELNMQQEQGRVTVPSAEPLSFLRVPKAEEPSGWRDYCFQHKIVTNIVVVYSECVQWILDVSSMAGPYYSELSTMLGEKSSRAIRHSKALSSWIVDNAKSCYASTILGEKSSRAIHHSKALSSWIVDNAKSCYASTMLGEKSSRAIHHSKALSSWIVDNAKSCYAGLRESVPEMNTLQIRDFLIPIIQLLSYTGECISTTLARTGGLVWQHLSTYMQDTQIAAFGDVWKSLITLHQLIVIAFEWLAVAASTYFLTGVSGTHDHWFYRTCLSAKVNSGPIIVMLEVLVGLAAMELALASLHTNRQSQARERAKSRGHQIAVSMSGTKPSVSLLRSSGGLSLSENSSRSMYSNYYE